jgi:DNA-binding LytR/AlgR family response regulator
VNDKDRRQAAAYAAAVRSILALLAFLFLAAAAPPRVAIGPIMECAGRSCAPIDLMALDLQGREATLARTVTVRPDALPLDRPLMVRIVAMASAEVRWNGTVIGRNGIPGPSPAGETPGRFVASFIVPAHLVRAGSHRVEIRLSAHHLWLPVRRAVHSIEVGPYESEELPGLADYLPALLALGALLAGFIYFATSFASDRARPALLLTLAAGAAIVQLLAEVSRAFVAYTYPWHLARVSLVALAAAAAAVLLTAYAARRFTPEWQRSVTAGTAGAAAASLALLPWYDIKAMSAIFAGLIACGLCAVRGRRRPHARTALAFAAAGVALLAWQLTDFLDRAWFLLLAILFVALVSEQVQNLRRARSERDAETLRAAGLSERLARAEREGEPILALKDGSRTRRVAEGDVVYIRAADDYCEAVLGDGRALLVTMTLSRLLETLPPRFLRVHKSYAVNRTHVAALAPKAGGGRVLSMSGGGHVPVGRSYAAAVARALGTRPSG